MADDKLKVFLLGGHDLEMNTIKDILNGLERKDIEEPRILFFDRGLKWGARLSEYKDELAKYSDDEKYEIYGIELIDDSQENGFKLPKNYKVIDHHNELCWNPSSLEQVAKVLGIKLNSEQKLIAANDRGYIPEMLKLNADTETIKRIRRMDLKCQGISEETIDSADEYVACAAREYPNFISVYAGAMPFSPIVDVLFREYGNKDTYLVYSKSEICLYASDSLVTDIYEGLTSKHKLQQSLFYRGGGFVGLGEGATETFVNEIKEEIMDRLNLFSTHTFFLPFSWKRADGDTGLFSLCNLEGSPWKRVSDTSSLYSERQYYFEYVHPALYDTGKPDSLMYHLERQVPEDSSYCIHYKGKDICIAVDYVNINFYSGGVGVMSIFCTNRNYVDMATIKIINDLGRKYVQAYEAENNDTIELTLGSEKLVQTYIADLPWKKSAFLEGFLNELKIENLEVGQILDDRMYVMSAIFNSGLSKEIQSGNFHESQNWYELLFCDQEKEMSCHNDDMAKELFQKANYLRWQKGTPMYGTLYGISRYSFLCVAAHMRDEFFSKILHNHMSTIYARMYEFAIFQMAAISVFSGKITDICKLMYTKGEPRNLLVEISKLYKDYLRFENRQSFNEITNQDQGIELYSIMQRQMGFSRKVAELDEKIAELHNFATLISNQTSNDRAEELNKKSHHLNIIAAIFVLPSLLAAAFSVSPEATCQYWWCFASVFILLAVMVVIGPLILNRLGKRK